MLEVSILMCTSQIVWSKYIDEDQSNCLKLVYQWGPIKLLEESILIGTSQNA